jgi:hypothetical protein
MRHERMRNFRACQCLYTAVPMLFTTCSPHVANNLMRLAQIDFETFIVTHGKFKKYIEEELVRCVAFVIQSSDVF